MVSLNSSPVCLYFKTPYTHTSTHAPTFTTTHTPTSTCLPFFSDPIHTRIHTHTHTHIHTHPQCSVPLKTSSCFFSPTGNPSVSHRECIKAVVIAENVVV